MKSAALQVDEIIRGRLFVASNGFPVFAPLKVSTRHFAKSESKDHAALSNVIGRYCVG